MLETGHTIAGRYVLVRLLAQGGMGSVWAARDNQLGREVAIKVMVPAASELPELVQRFEREARAAAQLRSAHAVQIFDHGLDGARPFIVMELLEGEDLAARLRRVPRMSLAETARILGDVCKGLRGAHEGGVVHRDLKPANIFLARQDDVEVVKILDFGVAKLTGREADMTRTNALLGTPHYMAPEQVRDTGVPVDHRADMWALGVLAFRLLTGRLPFSGTDPIDVLVRIASQSPPAPSSIAPDLGPSVDRFFAMALAREPAARFQSAQAFRDAIARLASEPGTAGVWPSSSSGWTRAASLVDGATIPIVVAPEIQPPPRVGTTTLPLAQAVPGWRPPGVVAAPPRVPVPGVPSPAPASPAPPERPSHSAEPTLPALSSTAATGDRLSQPVRTGVHWVVWAAGAAVVIVAAVVVASLVRTTADHAEAAPPDVPATTSAAATPPAVTSSAAATPPATASALPEPAPTATPPPVTPAATPAASSAMPVRPSPSGPSSGSVPTGVARPTATSIPKPRPGSDLPDMPD